MIKYFPFPPSFDLKMGTSAMKSEDTIVEIDEHYFSEITLKRSLLLKDHDYYFNTLHGSDIASWDALEKVMEDLVRLDPVNFSLDKKRDPQWHWANKLLAEELTFTFGEQDSLPFSPLDWIGRQVQEDLIILNTAGEVVAGQLCFPSGWSLHEKIGKQFMEVHAPLPSITNPMIKAAHKLIERIPLNKPITRNNWGFRYGNQRDLSSRYSVAYRQQLKDEIPGLKRDEFGENIFLRVEHQTLTRLLRSSQILFTIHTYNSPLRVEASNIERARTMLAFLKTTPAELIEYKVMTPFYEKLIDYLTDAVSQ